MLPLQGAVSSRNAEMVALLLRHGAGYGLRSEEGPVCAAVTTRQREMIRLLLPHVPAEGTLYSREELRVMLGDPSLMRQELGEGAAEQPVPDLVTVAEAWGTLQPLRRVLGRPAK